MTFLSRFGALVVGVFLLVAGVVLGAVAPAAAVASFGWFAYAPLSDTTFVAGAPASMPIAMWTWPTAAAAGVAVLGLLLIAGWVGFRLGRRRAVR